MAAADEADLERRFDGLKRLYGAVAYERLRRASVAVVGLGGVGSWAAEALARSGVATLVLIDLDHVAESNINRQVQALGATLGQSKVQALRARISDIHPGCLVRGVEAFVEPDNWPALLLQPVDALVDACDQVRAKLSLAAWGWAARTPVVCVGAAGGKQRPQCVEVAGLDAVTHDPLLASLRQRWRKQLREQVRDGLPQTVPMRGQHAPHEVAAVAGLQCVFSREPVAPPAPGCEVADAGDGSLNCHGYGSSVTVTATFGMVAAAQAIASIMRSG